MGDKKKPLEKIDEEMVDDKEIKSNSEARETEAAEQAAKKLAFDQEKDQLEQSLKILKVLNFLYSKQDLISHKGIRFIMKTSQIVGEGGSEGGSGSPSKQDSGNASTILNAPGFSDLDLQSGFAEIQPSDFHHHKLDSYL